MSNCIACGNPQVRPFYNPGDQPLAALNLPRSREDAIGAARYPMDFYTCLRCGHIFNMKFDVGRIPYIGDSNLMYNSGASWAEHLDAVVGILRDELGAFGKTVLDIGAGDGSLLDRLNLASQVVGGNTRCVAIEPGIESETCRRLGLEVLADYFVPSRDLKRYQPDILVCRHVLEHLQTPRKFISDIALRACQLDQSPFLLAEVPCIEKGLRQSRVGDFLYEHVSNFTHRSFCMMVESCGWDTLASRLVYNGEVILWLGKPKPGGYIDPPASFDAETIHALVDFTWLTYDRIVLWGGTGKSAAFLNAIKAPADYRVVDSDERKAGRYVPGTGQLIEHASSLCTDPAEAVIITTRWRAADIYAEIKRNYPEVEVIFVVEGDFIRQYTEEDYVKETP